MNYTVEYGSYYLRRENGDVALMTDQVAVAYDVDSYAMMKHGSPDQVLAWHRENAPKLRHIAELAVVTFPRGFDVEELNRVLSTSNYLGYLLPKLAQPVPEPFCPSCAGSGSTEAGHGVPRDCGGCAGTGEVVRSCG